MFIVLKGEICSLKSTFDCIHAYSGFIVYLFMDSSPRFLCRLTALIKLLVAVKVACSR